MKIRSWLNDFKEKRNAKKLREKYISATIHYTDAYAQFAYLKERIEDGEVVDDKDAATLADLISDLSEKREKFLHYQKLMGYTTGEQFLDDCHFRDCYLEKGSFYGEPKKLHVMCYPWYFDYVKGLSDNNFKFEVGCLLTAMYDIKSQS